MNAGHQETRDMQETQFGGTDETRQRRVIHFTSGETLEEDSEEEEEEEKPVFRETERKRFSFKNLASRVGRLTLLACDFLGQRLAGALGLNDAKYQYAIDQHQRETKTTGSGDSDPGTTPLSPKVHTGHYGATEEMCPEEGRVYSEDPHMEKGQHNKGYQEENTHLK